MKKKKISSKTAWEEICINCGLCCGSQDGDPCRHLVKKNKKYWCEVYKNRYRTHTTVAGVEFRCVTIKNYFATVKHIKVCAYGKYIDFKKKKIILSKKI